jgi:hypothetical protein
MYKKTTVQTPIQQEKKRQQTAMIVDDMAQIHDADAQISSLHIGIAASS